MTSCRIKRLKIIVISIIALSGTTFNSLANGDWTPVIGARTGAGVAFVTEPSGLSLNPALGAELGKELTLVPLYSVFNFQVDGRSIGLPKQGSIVKDIPGLFAGYNFHPTKILPPELLSRD